MLFLKNGFTFIELLITMSVMAIVVAVALPNFSEQIKDSRSEALGEEFSSALNYARMEAVKRSSRVSVCASSNGADCSDDWTDGWIVFLDYANADNVAPVTELSGASFIIKRWGKAATSSEISVKSNGTDVNFVRFTSLGALARLNNPPTTVVIKARIQGCSGNKARQLTVGISGVVNVANIACSAIF